jgi:colanic acid/amylovoran biosynthesis glycosyltransferase
MTKIGYVIPEYPGQTHSFFWRELTELRAAGIQPDIVSTRPPRTGRVGHAWTADPRAQAYYLMPPKLRSMAGVMSALARCLWSGEKRPGIAKMLTDWRTAVRTDNSGPRTIRWARQTGFVWAGADLASVARRRGWEHIHVHSCANSAQVALYARHLSGVPYSISLHGSLGDYGPNQGPRWRNAAFALVITEALAREVRNSLEGSLPPAMAIAPMGVQTKRSKRTVPYKAYGGTGVLRLISCGRLNASKGHDYLVRAVGLLHEAGHDVQLVILGEDDSDGGGYRHYLERVIQEAGLEAAVRLPGSVAESTVWEQLQAAHVFVLASHSEPLGVAIMEAMAMELPVVATRAGGVPELVDDGVEGILVEPASATAIVEGIERLIADPGAATRMGRAARQRVVSHFDSSQSARTLAELIRPRSKPSPPRGFSQLN